MSGKGKSLVLHLGLIALLFVLQFTLSAYHHGNLARIMVLASFAIAYNITFGYTGLLSLGHALFFAVGMYGMGLLAQHAGLTALPGLIAGIIAGLVTGLVTGALALRTRGVAFMIVTLMFAQAGYLTVLLFGEYTRGDEGFVVPAAARILLGLDLSQPEPRYWTAFAIFSLCLLGSLLLVQSPLGKALVAIRENEERAAMLGYDVFRLKLIAILISSGMAALAGAAYGLLFGYVGASFATVQYSIFPLLWVLLGGAGTILGPFLGTAFMFYLIDISSGITTAYMLIAGLMLVLLTLFAPQGIAGTIRRRLAPWLP